MTNSGSSGSWCGGCTLRAWRSIRPTTAPTASAWRWRAATTWSSSICSCREWTALRCWVGWWPSVRLGQIVLSCLTATATKVRCLEAGAEDYLAKPFSLEELLARVRARLRAAAGRSATSLVAGRLRLDLIRREADSGSGPVALADREFLLLRELMQHTGTTVSKQRLLAAVWQYYFDPGSNVVDVYVGRLRAKLGADTITTMRGEGYRIAAH